MGNRPRGQHRHLLIVLRTVAMLAGASIMGLLGAYPRQPFILHYQRISHEGRSHGQDTADR